MKTIDVGKIVSSIKSVLSEQNNDRIGLHEPCFEGNEWKYVKECIDTRWVSSVGKFVDTFEEQLAEFAGVKKAIATSNGTAALHICLKLVGVKANDEVLVPALTFIATANVVEYCDAIPHFVDSEEKTLGIDPKKLADYLSEIAVIKDNECFNSKTGRRIKAVVPMHTFGHPVDLDELVKVCEKYHIELVEDAAEALGTLYKGKHVGNWGKVTAVSFNGNKIITCGGGGAILTNDVELGNLAKHLTTQAKLPHKWAFRHDMVGYNYRMPNINAALGCAQLEQLPGFVKKKRALAERYCEAFRELAGVDFFVEPEFAKGIYWLNAIMLSSEDRALRGDVLTQLNDNGIMARPAWDLMYTLPMYKDNPRMECEVAENIVARLINIPSSVYL
ncbi:MAG: LegC family aminotransferase [Negativicutes bacterium]|jgi:perosamine synthetase